MVVVVEAVEEEAVGADADEDAEVVEVEARNEKLAKKYHKRHHTGRVTRHVKFHLLYQTTIFFFFVELTHNFLPRAFAHHRIIFSFST
jgi:hypothetical protein